MAKILEVSESGYHAWIKRQSRQKTEKQKQREQLKTLVLQIYLESKVTAFMEAVRLRER